VVQKRVIHILYRSLAAVVVGAGGGGAALADAAVTVLRWTIAGELRRVASFRFARFFFFFLKTTMATTAAAPRLTRIELEPIVRDLEAAAGTRERMGQYWDGLRRFLHARCTRLELEYVIQHTIGRQSAAVHNRLVCAILYNAQRRAVDAAAARGVVPRPQQPVLDAAHVAELTGPTAVARAQQEAAAKRQALQQ
jgi:hypothetical protein